MMIPQGDCPRGTCPRICRELDEPNPAIPQTYPFQNASVHQWSSHSQCPKLRALVLRWHAVVSDLKAEYHGADDPRPTGLVWA